MKILTSVIFSLFILGIYGASTIPAADLPVVSPSSDIPPVRLKPKTTTTTTTEGASTKATETTTTSKPEPEPTTTSTTTTTSTSTTPTVPTSVAPRTTTQKPDPTKPNTGKYIVTDKNQTCILIEFAAQLNITYINDSNQTDYLVYNLPAEDSNEPKKANGSCGNGTTDQNILIEWNENGQTNSLNLTFRLNATSNPKEYSLSEAVFNLSPKIIHGFNNTNNNSFVFYHVGSFFDTPKDRSYHCNRIQTLNLTSTETSKNVTGTVDLSGVQLQAFHAGQNKQYASAIDCDAINTPDIVPIAVGIALIALVVIVLIAYLVGRRRAQARGYVSM